MKLGVGNVPGFSLPESKQAPSKLKFPVRPKLPSELAPLEDRSMVGLAVIAPEGTSYESMEETMKEISNSFH